MPLRPSIIASLLALCCFGSGLAMPALAAGQVSRDGGTIRLEGEIDKAAAEAIRAHLAAGAHTLVVRSEGGDVEAGIAIATAMRAHPVKLVVDGYCFSSCANYLFIAAASKRLQPGAMLGFHGGLDGGEEPAEKSASANAGGAQQHEISRSLIAQFSRSLRADARLFRELGVDRGLIRESFERTRLPEAQVTITVTDSEGKEEIFRGADKDRDSLVTKALERMSALQAAGKFAKWNFTRDPVHSNRIYFPSAATLARYGVGGIEAYPYPATQEALDQLARTVFQRPLEAVGDFPTAAD